MKTTRAQQQQQQERQQTHFERQLEEREYVFDILNFEEEVVEDINHQNINNLRGLLHQGRTFMMV